MREQTIGAASYDDCGAADTTVARPGLSFERSDIEVQIALVG
jgi:hypothetical protein